MVHINIHTDTYVLQVLDSQLFVENTAKNYPRNRRFRKDLHYTVTVMTILYK